MIKYEVFMVDLIFTLNLVDDQLGIAISFKILYPHLLSEVEANEQSIILSYVVGIAISFKTFTNFTLLKILLTNWQVLIFLILNSMRYVT